jgi:N-acetyl-anhydromuramyl-L-alanine amidase AmpD
MLRPTTAEAQDFFAQLYRFSTRLIKKALPGTPDASSNVSRFRSPGRPKGAILHYTASGTWQSPVRWFCGFPDSKASAHVVVCDRRAKEAEGLDDDLPLVKALGVTCIQCVPPGMSAWHATWANPLCYGIENRNCGLVRRDSEDKPWRHWPKGKGQTAEWTSPAPSIPDKAYQAQNATEGYEPYARQQLIANVMLLRYVGAMGGRPLDPALVLPHSAVQSGKWDPGPLFPIHEVRRLGCLDDDEEHDSGFKDLTDPAVHTSLDDVPDVVYSEERKGSPDDPPEGQDALDKALAAGKRPQLAAMVKDAAAPNVRRQLDRLGFYVPLPPTAEDVLDSWLQRALWAFQTGAGVSPTSKPDGPTLRALEARMKSLGLV